MKRSLAFVPAGFVATAGALAYAAFHPQSQIFGTVLVAPRRAREIALTFDDGPNPTATPRLLDLLASHNIRATFFLIGRYALAQPELAQASSKLCRTPPRQSHHDPPQACPSAAATPASVAELRDRSQRAIEDIGRQPRSATSAHRTAHRTPYVLRVARGLGLHGRSTGIIIANDWTASAPSPRSLINADRTQASPRSRRRGFASNIVLHDGSQATPHRRPQPQPSPPPLRSLPAHS